MESYSGLRHMRLETCGYQPYAKAAKLPLIPKRRYEYMDAYFKHTETMEIRMMCGSASTQVSIVYLNQQDFVKKFQLAQMLSPRAGAVDGEDSGHRRNSRKTAYSKNHHLGIMWIRSGVGLLPCSISQEFSFSPPMRNMSIMCRSSLR